MSEWNHDLDACPYQTVVEVMNDCMEEPVRATRGHVTETGVHPNQHFFTTVFTPGLFGTMGGGLACPNRWRLLPEDETTPEGGGS